MKKISFSNSGNNGMHLLSNLLLSFQLPWLLKSKWLLSMLVSGGILTSWSPARSQNLRMLSCLTLSVNIKPCWAKSGMNTTDVSFFVSFKIESLVKILLNSVIRLIIEFLPRSQLICFCFRIGLMERSQKSQMQS